MFKQRELIKRCLLEHFPDANVYAFAEEHVQKQESFDFRRAAGAGTDRHPGTWCEISCRTGQQAQDRILRRPARQPQALSPSSAPASACSTCAATPAASASTPRRSAARSEVVGVDLDEGILEIAEKNAHLNKAKVRFVQADIFAWLRDVAAATANSSTSSILDPAKMTRDREQVIPALKKYLDMNKLALGAVKPGGILLTCSCTGLVSEEQFLDMLRRAAFYANRTLQVLKVSGAGPDHPWLAHVPESRYLKAAFCRVE